MFEPLCFLSGAADQRDLPLPQPARPPAVELRGLADGAPLQGGHPQPEPVWTESLQRRARRGAEALLSSPLTCSRPVQVWVDPPALHANVSLLTDPTDDNLLTVSAVVGQNESERAPAGGILFSYDKASLAKRKCECL